MIKKVDYYLKNVLTPKLNAFGVSDGYISKVCKTVEMQMESALINWKNARFRKTLMLLVSEEAKFYKPDTNIEVKSFVALTLRNSPFESLQSDNYRQTGLTKWLNEENIKEVTSEAIKYFKKCELEYMAGEVPEIRDDFYYNLSREFPVAWKALSELANCEGNACVYEPMGKKSFGDDNIVSDGAEKAVKAVKDGYDSVMDESLSRLLESVGRQGSAFYADCFKMVSRHPKIVLSAIEYLLAHGCPFVTCNYYITDGYCEKREKILRAASSRKDSRDAEEHLKNYEGISDIHRKAMELVSGVLEK